MKTSGNRETIKKCRADSENQEALLKKRLSWSASPLLKASVRVAIESNTKLIDLLRAEEEFLQTEIKTTREERTRITASSERVKQETRQIRSEISVIKNNTADSQAVQTIIKRETEKRMKISAEAKAKEALADSRAHRLLHSFGFAPIE